MSVSKHAAAAAAVDGQQEQRQQQQQDAPAPAASAAGGAQFEKGQRVMYRTREGTWQPAKVSTGQAVGARVALFWGVWSEHFGVTCAQVVRRWLLWPNQVCHPAAAGFGY